MLFALGAVSSALDAIKSLTSSSSSSGQPAGGFGDPATNPFDLSGNAPVPSIVVPASGGLSQLSPATMSALLAAQGQWSTSASAPTGASGALQDLFSKIDANGGISKSEFENALGAGGTNLAQADDVFNKLDTNGDGTVSLGELWSAMKGNGFGGHHHQVAGAGTGGGQSTTGGTGSTSVAAGVDGCIRHLGHQQQRLDHDVVDVCRRLGGDDDAARRDHGHQRCDVVLQPLEQMIQREARRFHSRLPPRRFRSPPETVFDRRACEYHDRRMRR